MFFKNLFKKKARKRSLVIGEPYDVEHVFHIGIDSPPPTNISSEFWAKNFSMKNEEYFYF
jgi:hypothetical protein